MNMHNLYVNSGFSINFRFNDVVIECNETFPASERIGANKNEYDDFVNRLRESEKLKLDFDLMNKEAELLGNKGKNVDEVLENGYELEND